jgi:hypothetical protein
MRANEDIPALGEVPAGLGPDGPVRTFQDILDLSLAIKVTSLGPRAGEPSATEMLIRRTKLSSRKCATRGSRIGSRKDESATRTDS